MTAVTVSQSKPQETDISDKTDTISNLDFLREVFRERLEGACPVVVSFKGDPRTASKKSWSVKPWQNQGDRITSLLTDANNYFSLAVFYPDTAGEYRRLKTSFRALHAVMLDDIGTKVLKNRMTLPPSWLLETSPGNCQAGYLLSEPLMDGTAADRLMNAVVAAGLCDPGANGPTTRLARLPVAVNGKHSPPFGCRLLMWSPELRYTVDELVDGLQLEIMRPDRPRRQGLRQSNESPADGDPVWIPPPDENVVLATLWERGLYKAPLGEGKHNITCPWVEEHTDQIDGGTAYFEPDELWPIGGFKCQHGHCSGRHIRDLLRALEIEPSAARMKPTIRVIPGELNRVVDAAERELARSLRHYQRGGLIATVITDPGTHETRVQDITRPALIRALAGAATWERYDRRSENWVRTDPPANHAAVLFDSSHYPHLPVLNGLARQPYLRADGSMMTASGYDPISGMFGIFDARTFSVPDSPTREQAESAFLMLMGLLEEFPFVDASDLSATLAAMLTAAVRPSLEHAPMFHVRAPMVGSGKSYLCELIAAFATPQRGAPTTFPSDDEECRKMLLAELLKAPAVIEFDNLTTDLLAHKSLCMVLTSEFMTGRILGVSKTSTVSTRTLFLSSGNNVGPVQDMTRRCLTIRLNPGCDTPAARSFKRPDLIRELLNERGRYVSAALTVIRAWIAAGRPKALCWSLSGYSQWSDLCRQPLLWLGCTDPTASVFEAMKNDPDRETLGRMLKAWQAIFGNTPAMVRDAVKQALLAQAENQELNEVLRDIADERGEINRRKLGRWIKRHEDHVVDGLRFVRAEGKRSAEAWQVKSVESVLSVSTVCVPQEEESVSNSTWGGE